MRVAMIIFKILVGLLAVIGLANVLFFLRGGNPLPFPDRGGAAILATTSKDAQLAVLNVLRRHGAQDQPVMKQNTKQVDRAFLTNDTIVNFSRPELETKLRNARAGYQIVSSNPQADAKADAVLLKSFGFQAEVLVDPEGEAKVPGSLVFLLSDAFADYGWAMVYRYQKVSMGGKPPDWEESDWQGKKRD